MDVPVNDSGRGGSVFNRTGVHPSAVPARCIADLLADFMFRISSEYGRPMVLSVEDREEIAGFVAQVMADDYIDSPSDGYAMKREGA